ncbi:retropepsin-like domain-containing protein [bacterium]|nr:retropepsin-like domain-containing protein [bacterium]
MSCSGNPKDSGQELQPSFSYDIPVVEARIAFEENKTKSFKLLVDTGVPYPLSLFTYSELGIQTQHKYIEVTDEGLNGIASFELGRVSGIQIGSFEFGQPLVAYMSDVDMGTAVILGKDGFLGNEILKRFRVTFDYPGKHMFLKPNTISWNI